MEQCGAVSRTSARPGGRSSTRLSSTLLSRTARDNPAPNPSPPSTPRSPRAVRCAPSCRRRCARQTVEDILAVASRAPSGTNTQPWKVYVLTGEAKADAVAQDRRRATTTRRRSRSTARSTTTTRPNGSRPTSTGGARSAGTCTACSASPRATRRACTLSTGATIVFFDAPVGLMFTIDRVMRQGSWLDYGMFLQSVMIAARARGLDTCPQAAFLQFHRIILEHVGAPRQRNARLRHVARPCRSGGARERARHRARAGGRFREVPRMKSRSRRVLVARAVFPSVLDRGCASTSRSSPTTPTIRLNAAELTRRLQGKAGVFATGSERIDAALLDACPQLRAVCNMAVGYNNIDVDACTARGVRRHQHARRADRDHGRLRLRADDGHRAPHGRGRALPAPRRSGRSGPTTCSPAATCTARRSASSAWAASARRSRGAARSASA